MITLVIRIMNERRGFIYTGFCLMVCKPGKVAVPSLDPTLATFSLPSYHLLPFKSIGVVKSPFIAQVDWVLKNPGWGQGWGVWLFSVRHRAQNSFVKILIHSFCKMSATYPKSTNQDLIKIISLIFPQGPNKNININVSKNNLAIWSRSEEYLQSGNQAIES